MSSGGAISHHLQPYLLNQSSTLLFYRAKEKRCNGHSYIAQFFGKNIILEKIHEWSESFRFPGESRYAKSMTCFVVSRAKKRNSISILQSWLKKFNFLQKRNRRAIFVKFFYSHVRLDEKSVRFSAVTAQYFSHKNAICEGYSATLKCSCVLPGRELRLIGGKYFQITLFYQQKFDNVWMLIRRLLPSCSNIALGAFK